MSCQVSSSLPSKVEYFPGLNSSQFGTWDRGREGVNLIPVQPLAFPSLTSVSGAAEIPTIWLGHVVSSCKVTTLQRYVLCMSAFKYKDLS